MQNTSDSNHTNFTQSNHQNFIEKQKILFSYQIKKILIYFFLLLLLLIFGKVLLRISDILASPLSYRTTFIMPPLIPEPSPSKKTLPHSLSIKADTSKICIASYKNGSHPGIIIDGRCVIAYGSEALSLSHYKKLPAENYSWVQFDYYKNRIPMNAVIGGQEPIVDETSQNLHPYETLRNLYICRTASPAKDTDYIGKIVDGVCNYTLGNESRQSDEYEILVGEPDNH